MSDLISRSALLEALMKEEKECEDCMVMPSWYLALRIIKNQPTAYDVDKVAEELEEYKKSKENLYVGRVVGAIIDYAIEIVRGGGVNEIKN